MQVILVGDSRTLERLRAQADRASLEVVAEFPTIAAARQSGVRADAILIDPARPDGSARLARIDRDERPAPEPLTPREIQVLELLAEGLSNKAIAASLGVSDQTVKFHVASISGKLGAANRTEAVRIAVSRGLIAL